METSVQVLLLTAVLILLAKVMGHLSSRLGLPSVLGELLAGVLLGPTLLNVWSWSWFAGGPLRTVFSSLAQLGVVVLMFLAGLETDVAVMKATVRPAFWSACGGVILPMAGGCILSRAFGFSWSEAVFIGTILTATSVTITAQTLMNLGELQSRAGSTILGAAVIDDVLGLIVLSMVVAANSSLGKGHSFDWVDVVKSTARMAGFLIAAFLWGPRLVAHIFRYRTVSSDHHLSSSVALALSFLFAFAAVFSGGMAAITGAYIAGLFVSITPIRERIIDNVRCMSSAFFGPLFLVSIGLEINARELGGQLEFFCLAVGIAIVGKIIGCGVSVFFNGFGLRESTIVGIGMIPRGEVGLITANLGWVSGVINQMVYTQVVVLVLITTLVTPPLLRIAFGKHPAEPPVGDTKAIHASAGGGG